MRHPLAVPVALLALALGLARPLPSGAAVAAAADDGGADVSVIDADGSHRVNLTASGAAAESAPHWSPDGERIAYYADRFNLPEERVHAVFVVRPDGSESTEVTADLPGCKAHAWSPDGARLAVYCWVPGQSVVIYTVGVDGSAPTRVAEVPPPSPRALARPAVAWSPRGERLAFVAWGPSDADDLFVVNADGTGLTNLTDDAAVDSDPAWSPDGTRLAFVSAPEREGAGQIAVVGVDGGRAAPLTTGAGRYQDPAWSPDGTSIAYAIAERDAERVGVYTIGADGSDPVRLTEFGAEPEWAPDGATIAFVGTPDRNRDIFVVGTDGSPPSRLGETTDEVERSPVWSPDGSRIAFYDWGRASISD